MARGQWLLAELSIVATDLAEVLGAALAFHLLLGVSITTGVVLTAFDTLIVLACSANFRRLEAIVLGLIATIGACFFVELVLIGPYWPRPCKTQQTMTINFRGFSQRLGGRRRPNQAQSIILVAMALSASVRLLEGGTSRRTGLRPSSLPSGHRCPARSTRV